jgi:hypothetical protein
MVPKDIRSPASETSIGPGMTPAIIAVHGSSVDAQLSVAPSQQVVRGLSVSSKISVQ